VRLRGRRGGAAACGPCAPAGATSWPSGLRRAAFTGAFVGGLRRGLLAAAFAGACFAGAAFQRRPSSPAQPSSQERASPAAFSPERPSPERPSSREQPSSGADFAGAASSQQPRRGRRLLGRSGLRRRCRLRAVLPWSRVLRGRRQRASFGARRGCRSQPWRLSRRCRQDRDPRDESRRCAPRDDQRRAARPAFPHVPGHRPGSVKRDKPGSTTVRGTGTARRSARPPAGRDLEALSRVVARARGDLAAACRGHGPALRPVAAPPTARAVTATRGVGVVCRRSDRRRRCGRPAAPDGRRHGGGYAQACQARGPIPWTCPGTATTGTSSPARSLEPPGVGSRPGVCAG
jgi:hypothetical protein